MSSLKQISDSELEIMKVIWNNGGNVLFAEIMSELSSKEKVWKTNTVLTFLSRLNEKGYISISKKGRLNQYVAVISEKEYANQQTKLLVNKVYGGSAKSLVSSLIKQDYITNEDINELKKFWEEGV